MPAAVRRAVHLHDSVFIKKRLLFFGELVRLTETEGMKEAAAISNSLRVFVHAERSGRHRISFRLFDAVPDA